VALVEAALLAVDPAEAERQLQCLGIGDARRLGPLLGDLQPEPPGLGVALIQPGLKLGGVAKSRIGSSSSIGGILAQGHSERGS